MTSTLNDEVTKNIIRKLINGQDYRIEIISIINAEFLQYTIDFFKKVIDAKLKDKDIDIDWYKKEFLNEELPSEEIAINSGLNKKTISNMYNSGTREIVIKASNEHYDELYKAIQKLVDGEEGLDIKLTLKFNNVSVDLNVNESLIVINTLAVKRSALRGGLWSTAGKRVETPLMKTLCKLYDVDDKNYKVKYKKKLENESSFERDVDFYICDQQQEYRCEVKLMGKGNPESADAVIARDSKVFIADKLSETNKKQLDFQNIYWIELRSNNGYAKFEEVLTKLNIPHKDKIQDVNEKLDSIFTTIFQ